MSELVKLVEYLHNNWSVLWNGRYPFGVVLLLLAGIGWKLHQYRIKKIREEIAGKHEPQAKVPLIEKTLSTKTQKPKPNLMCTEVALKRVMLSPANTFVESEFGDGLGLVAVINNRVAEQPSGSVSTVKAQAVFYRDSGSVEQYNCMCYWLGQFQNNVDFPVGTSRTLLIMGYKDGTPCGMSNERSQPLPHRARHAIQVLESSSSSLKVTTLDIPLSGTVQLFDSENRVILKLSFRVFKDQEGKLHFTRSDDPDADHNS